MASSIAKALGLPTITLDFCIVEALCVCNCPATSTIISVMNELYETAKKYAVKEDGDDETELEGDSSLIFNIYQIIFYIIDAIFPFGIYSYFELFS